MLMNDQPFAVGLFLIDVGVAEGHRIGIRPALEGGDSRGDDRVGVEDLDILGCDALFGQLHRGKAVGPFGLRGAVGARLDGDGIEPHPAFLVRRHDLGRVGRGPRSLGGIDDRRGLGIGRHRGGLRWGGRLLIAGGKRKQA